MSPYNDVDESSKLSTRQTCYFYTNYAVVILLFICSFVFYIVYAASCTIYDQGYCWIDSLYLTMIFLQLSSQFCAIQSCFIFSKVVYKVTNKLKKVAKVMSCVNFTGLVNEDSQVLAELETLFPEKNESDYRDIKELLQTKIQESNSEFGKFLQLEKIDRGRYYLLQKMDQNFINQVKPILELLGIWFVFHWTLYALTTVLLSAFIVEIIVDILKFDFQSVDDLLPNGKVGTLAPYCIYVVFFTLVHAYLFLYPCFRAAAIATARAKMISVISKTRWLSISLSVQNNFVQYLTSQNFAFRVPLFCVSIPIGFNWVFVSFFVPVLGAYLSF